MLFRNCILSQSAQWRAFQGVAVVGARLSGLQHYCMLSDICCGVGFMTTVYKCCRGGGLNLDFHASGRFVHTLTDQTLNTNIYGPRLFIIVVVVVVIVVVYSLFLFSFLCNSVCLSPFTHTRTHPPTRPPTHPHTHTHK